MTRFFHSSASEARFPQPNLGVGEVFHQFDIAA